MRTFLAIAQQQWQNAIEHERQIQRDEMAEIQQVHSRFGSAIDEAKVRRVICEEIDKFFQEVTREGLFKREER